MCNAVDCDMYNYLYCDISGHCSPVNMAYSYTSGGSGSCFTAGWCLNANCVSGAALTVHKLVSACEQVKLEPGMTSLSQSYEYIEQSCSVRAGVRLQRTHVTHCWSG